MLRLHASWAGQPLPAPHLERIIQPWPCTKSSIPKPQQCSENFVVFADQHWRSGKNCVPTPQIDRHESAVLCHGPHDRIRMLMMPRISSELPMSIQMLRLMHAARS